ncbi:MAG TPA: amino acid permease [Acidobacteriaceae bacterium]|jgi:APA family basic amino acid/polyamine antiporter|nr:amino acid permease [Acidobacteriaceae bacterium]
MVETPSEVESAGSPRLAARLGLFDATMMVMGGIVGAGVFMNPYVVAQRLHSPAMILAVWGAGGCIAMLGAFIYAELGDRIPQTGGQYEYLRQSLHPVFGFLYGWALLLVIQTGGMAAVTVTFARYFLELTQVHASEHMVVIVTLALLTAINCLGVQMGGRLQSLLMVLKIAAIAALVGAGFFFVHTPQPLLHPVLDRPMGLDLVTALGAAMVPVLFSYGGWQTTTFIAGEIRNPRKNLTRALVIGVAGVVVLYVCVNVVCLRALGVGALANTSVPASAVMRIVAGERGARLIALGIAISTVGFLSQSVLTGPRVYFAMAEDGLFFRSVAYLTRRTRVPVVAIVLQSVWTVVIALTGKYEQILNFQAPIDFTFFGLSACCLFVLRRRDRSGAPGERGFRVPWHPFSTALFVLACWFIVANALWRYPANSSIGFVILVLGLPVYAVWARRQKKREEGR